LPGEDFLGGFGYFCAKVVGEFDGAEFTFGGELAEEIGRASCRERV